MAGRPPAVALAAVVLAFLWQALTVRYNYGGNWTGLFCTGARQPVPRDLAGETIYAIPNSYGYDGQFYHYIAHDPLGRSGLPNYIDAPRLRYTRILVPALAYILAAGQPRLIDAAYFSVVQGFVFLGAFWLARLALLHGRPAWWGFLFLALPASAVSIDRMTVDVALAALWVGFAVLASRQASWPILAILALAPLVRETGLAIAAVYGLCSMARRQYGKTALSAAAVLPVAAWWLYVWNAFPSYNVGWIGTAPLRGLWSAAAALAAAAPVVSIAGLAAVLNLVAVLGSLAAVALAFRFGVGNTGRPMDAAITVLGALGAGAVLMGSSDVWVHVYGHGRLLTPLLAMLLWRALERRSWGDLVPLALVTPAVALQLAGDGWRILRGLGGGLTG